MKPPGRMWKGAVLGLALVLGGVAMCRATTPEPPQVLTEAAGIRFVEILTGGAQQDDAVPIIIAIHGRGGRPENLGRAFRDLSFPARIILPQGLEPLGEGYTWFGRWENDAEFGAVVKAAADKLAPMIAEVVAARPSSGKAVVTGFSQGGMLSYALAVLHPEVVRAAVPISGKMSRSLGPAPGAHTVYPRILAIHGTLDQVVAIDDDRDTVARLRTLGYRVELAEVPGAAHELNPAMREQIATALRRAIAE